MSILSIIRPITSSVFANQAVRTTAKNFGRGTIGLVNIGGHGLSAYHSYYQHRDQYGAGGAVLRGLGESLATDAAFAFMGLKAIPFAAIGYGGYMAVKMGQANYQQNRNIRMGRSVNTEFSNQMKMASIRSLSRDKMGAGRTLGSEAQILHNKYR